MACESQPHHRELIIALDSTIGVLSKVGPNGTMKRTAIQTQVTGQAYYIAGYPSSTTLSVIAQIENVLANHYQCSENFHQMGDHQMGEHVIKKCTT